MLDGAGPTVLRELRKVHPPEACGMLIISHADKAASGRKLQQWGALDQKRHDLHDWGMMAAKAFVKALR